MSVRRYFLDHGPDEVRAVVTLDDLPERLLIARDGDPGEGPRLGERFRAKVRRFEASLGSAFLDLGGDMEAVLAARPGESGARPGQSLIVDIKSEPRRGKLAVARFVEPGEGAPQQLSKAPALAEQLAALAAGAPIEDGPAARRVADEAEDAALAVVHPLPGGGDLAIEPTRALVSIDVDVGERRAGEGKRAARQANLAAIAHAARVLRLKGLGGLVVFDLAGRGHDGPAMLAAARAAFAPDQPGVAIGPISRFGSMEVVLPRTVRPLVERLGDHHGHPSDDTLASRLIRRIESEAARSGARLTAGAAPSVAQAARRRAAALASRIGARFEIEDRPDWPPERMEVTAT